MLNEWLIVQTTPQVNEENVVLWRDYRVSVLADRLFRIEQSPQLIFRDSATQAVWHRDMPPVDFRVTQDAVHAIIETSACRLILHKDRTQVCVEFENKRKRLDNYGNLLGTYRTLDCCNGDIYFKNWVAGETPRQIKLGLGVCSKSGVAVLDDSDSLTLGNDGQIKHEKAIGSDEYVFVYGNDYRGALKALYSITGRASLVPRFALGNWWSRYHVYTDEEYLRVINRFEDKHVPISVATVDMDWHYSEKVDEEMQISARGLNQPQYVGEYEVNLGWTGYTWNTNLFPDPQGFLNTLHEKGMKVTLNVHPSDGFRFWEDAYTDMANAMGMDPSTGAQVPFDFSYDRFINAYFNFGHVPHERMGVDFWWIDWQQENIEWHEKSPQWYDADGLDTTKYDPLWALNHYHYFDNAARHTMPLILSRYAGVGSHRYPIGFSGDTEISWKTLAYLPYFTATASNIGYTWWSHDIGGHNLGEKSNELFVRHLQYGVFSPINRLHCTCDETMTKEPWAYKNGAGLIAEEFLRLRHKLVPYLYTANYLNCVEGTPLIEPLYYEWKEKEAYDYKEEYRFGSELLVAPVTQKAHPDGYARIRAWIPAGTWTDIFTGDVYKVNEGGTEKVLIRSLDSMPVLAKAGAILPLSLDNKNEVRNPENMAIWVFEGNGAYTLYEDGLEERNASVLFTDFTSEYTETEGVCTQSLMISARGDATVIPQNRMIHVMFKNVQDGEVYFFINGERVNVQKRLSDCVSLKIPFGAGNIYQVSVVYNKRTDLELWQERAKQVLIEGEGANPEKSEVWKAILQANTIEECVNVVENSALTAVLKQRLKETL